MLKYFSDIPDVPKAIGPYSQATSVDGLIFLSGQIPIDPAVGKLVAGGIEEQTTQVLKNIKALLGHFKLDFSHVAKSTIFLSDLGNFQTVNKLYEAALGGAKPARSTVQVAGLPLGAMVEIEMIALGER